MWIGWRRRLGTGSPRKGFFLRYHPGSVDIGTRLQAGGPRSRVSTAGTDKIFLSSITFRLALGTADSFPGGKAQVREADHTSTYC
jgi:hypothetical protein